MITLVPTLCSATGDVSCRFVASAGRHTHGVRGGTSCDAFYLGVCSGIGHIDLGPTPIDRWLVPFGNFVAPISHPETVTVLLLGILYRTYLSSPIS